MRISQLRSVLTAHQHPVSINYEYIVDEHTIKL